MAHARIEDRRLITGTGRYTADWDLPGQLHAAMIRSDRAHAELKSLDVSAVRTAPGVRAVITATEIAAAGFKAYPWGAAFPGRNGEMMKRANHMPLSTDAVRYVGEPIAMIVADTAEHALDAVELANIDYQDLPAIVDMEAAAAPGAPQLHAHIPGNLGFDYEDGDAEAVAAAFARAKYVTRYTLKSQRVSSNPMEPRAILVNYKPDSGGYTIYTSHQGVLAMRSLLSGITEVPPEKFEVIAQDVGGSYGTRIQPYAEHIAAMAAAKLLGRPIKWVGSRTEAFLSDFHGRALTLNAELAMDAEGNFLAMRYDDWGDIGGYQSPWSAFIAAKGLTITMGGVYRVPALYGRVRCVYTNTTPVAAYRGAGRPDIACTIERLVDEAAAEHGFDRVALRRRNQIPKSAMPFKTANGTTYDSGDFAGAMDEGLRRADYAGFPVRRKEAEARGKLRGIGFATYLEAAAAGVAPKDQTEARFDLQGRLTIYTVAMSQGQGHETTFAEIIANALGVPRESVQYRGSDPHTSLVGNATGGSRSLAGVGSSLKRLGEVLIETGKPHAAGHLECAEGDLEYVKGAYVVKGTDRKIGFFDLAQRVAPKTAADKHPLDSVGEATSGATFPNGCHVAEVEIDPATGVTTIVNYTAVDDFGTVISPQLVEGQVQGGVLQGIGQVLGEHAYYDPATGQFLAATYLDYPMPRAGWTPDFSAHHWSVPTPTNLLGAKGVGESGCSGALPSMLNALIDAVRPLGINDLEMPVTPARLWAAIRDARGAKH